MDSRPKIKIELSLADKSIEILAWLSILSIWILAIYFYSNLPSTIATHFNALGQPDDYGSKATILLLPIIGTVLFIGLSILNMFPHIFNYPKAITEENARSQYTLATKMIRLLKLSVSLIFTWIVVQIYQSSSGKSVGLGIWFLPLILALIFIPVIFFTIKMLKNK